MAKATTGKKKVFRKKEKKNVPAGIAHVAASFNNTMISITDLEGNLIAQSSAGARGFRGSRKGTPFAAQQAAYEAAKKAHEAGMQQCEVRDVTREAIQARDEDEGRVNAFVSHCLDSFYGFKLPVLGAKRRNEASQAMKNFYRNPGTNLYQTMIDGTDTYKLALFQKL